MESRSRADSKKEHHNSKVNLNDVHLNDPCIVVNLEIGKEDQSHRDEDEEDGASRLAHCRRGRFDRLKTGLNSSTIATLR